MLTRVGHIARSSSGVLARLASTGTGSAQVTQLPNGLRVVTDNTPREVASVSVAIGGGASASTYQTRGVAHAVARNAFLVRSATHASAHARIAGSSVKPAVRGSEQTAGGGPAAVSGGHTWKWNWNWN